MELTPITRAERSREWQAGYGAALADAIALIDSLRGPAKTNLSAPILLRIRARLLDLHAARVAPAA